MACKQKVHCKSFTSDISLPIPFLSLFLKENP